MAFDVIIRNGRWFDGTGARSAARVLGIRDGRVAAVSEEPLDARGRPEVVDARDWSTSTPTTTWRCSRVPGWRSRCATASRRCSSDRARSRRSTSAGSTPASDGDKVADPEDDFPVDPNRSKMTAAMENAIDTASAYLDYSSFSRTGLINQLEFEGYATADATFAVDYLKINWNEQAFKSAKSNLDYSSFSLQGLINQLVFEGFTYEQASYGAKKAY